MFVIFVTTNNTNMLNKRTFTFWRTDSSLTSRRVSIILGSREDSTKLANAARALRHDQDSSITLSKETKEKIEAEAKRPKSA